MKEIENVGEKTLGTLIRNQIKYLILVKKEYKLAMDLWIGMVGLLFNNANSLEMLTKENAETDANRSDTWIDLNKLCYNKGTGKVKYFSSKVWRILFYCVSKHLDEFNETSKPMVLDLLKTPFDMSRPYINDSDVSKALLYCLRGLVYANLCGPAQSSKESLSLFISNLLKPILIGIILVNQHLHHEVVSVLLRLLGKPLPETRSPEKGNRNGLRPAPIKVIASTGIATNDISKMTNHLIKQLYYPLSDLIFSILRKHILKPQPSSELLISLLNNTPLELKTVSYLEEVNQVMIDILKTSDDHTEISLLFQTYTHVVVTIFPNLLLNKETNYLEDYLKLFEPFWGDVKEMLLDVLKDFLREKKLAGWEFYMMGIFLKTKDTLSHLYVENWIGSTLLSPTMSYTSFLDLANIINQITTDQVMENFLDLCSKMSLSINYPQLLNLKQYNDKNLSFFIKTYLSKNSNALDNNMSQFLIEILSENRTSSVPRILLPLLIDIKRYDIIKTSIEQRPLILSIVSDPILLHLKDILPTSKMSYLIINIGLFPQLIQYGIIQWVLEKDETALLLSNYATIETILFVDKPTDTSVNEERKKLIQHILHYLFENRRWVLLSNLIDSCLSNSQTDYIISLFSGGNATELQNILPQTLANMINRCGSLNPSLIDTLKQNYSLQKADYIITLISELVECGKTQALILSKQDMLLFIIDSENALRPVDQRRILELMPRFIQSLQNKSEKTFIDFLKMLFNLLPEHSNQYLLNLVQLFKESLPSSFKNSKSRREMGRLNKNFQRWKDETKSIEPTSGEQAISSESTMSTPEGFDKSTKSQNSSSNDNAEIQVPATQLKQDNDVTTGTTTAKSAYSYQFKSSTEDESTDVLSQKSTGIIKSPEELIQPTKNTHYQEEKAPLVSQELPSYRSSQDPRSTQEGKITNGDGTAIPDSSIIGTLEEVDKQIAKEPVTQSTGCGQLENHTNIVGESSDLPEVLEDENAGSIIKDDLLSTENRNDTEIGNELVVAEPTPTVVEAKIATVSEQVIPMTPSKTNPQTDAETPFQTPRSSLGVEPHASEKDAAKTIDSDDKTNGFEERLPTNQTSQEVVTDLGGERGSPHAKSVKSNDSIIVQSKRANKNNTNEEPNDIECVEGKSGQATGQSFKANPSKSSADSDKPTNLDTKEMEEDNLKSRNELRTALDEKETKSRTYIEGEEDKGEDDFAPVNTAQQDPFLEAMEKEVSQTEVILKSSPIAKNKRPTSSMHEINIPIFNTLKLTDPSWKERSRTQQESTTRMGQQKQIDSSQVTSTRSDKQDVIPSHLEVDLHSSFPYGTPGNGIDDDMDINSRETTPSLRMFFPSRKTRRLVSRLRNFDPSELSTLPTEERRNLRIELLDFLMKLEYYTGDDADKREI